MEWASETPKSLWKKISDEVEEYFAFKLDWYALHCSHSFSVVDGP